MKEEEYYDLMNNSENIELLKCSSILIKNDDGNYKFIHNNFGEYLASQKLKYFSIEEIKNIVCYKNIENRINPSWVNTLTFLVNDERYEDREKLGKWILECMPDFFIQIEDKNIDLKIKQDLFWKLFYQFKKKKMWIQYKIYESSNIYIEKEDVKKLIEEINENYHYTSVGNALHILKNTINLFDLNDELKSVLIKMCTDKEYTMFNRAIAIEVLAERGLIDYKELKEIIMNNKEEESSYLRKSYFYSCNRMNIVDEMIDMLLTRYDMECSWINIGKSNTDDIYYWDEHKEYEEAFSKIKREETIEIILEFFENKKLYNKEDNYKLLENLFKSLDNIYKDKNNFVDICLRIYLIYEKDYLYKCMDYIIDILKTQKLMLEFFKKFMKKGSDKSFLQYEKIIDNDCLDYYYDEYNKGSFDNEETLYVLRFSNEKLESYTKLKELYEERTGNKIQEKECIDYKKIQRESTIYFINKIFNKEEFINMINDFENDFKEKYDCENICAKDLFEYKHRALTNESSKYYCLCNFILKHFRDEENINTKKIERWNDWNFVILSEVYEVLKNDENSIKLSIEQIEKIKEICNVFVSKVNFRESITYSKNNTFSVNWLSIFLHFYRYKFNFKYPENVLLDMLEFDWMIDGSYIGIEYIVKNVDKLKVRERVIENLNSGKIRGKIYVNHIKYCIDNNISECIDLVGKYLNKKNNDFDERKYSTQYILKYTEIEDFCIKYLEQSTIAIQKELLGYIQKEKKKKIVDYLLEKNKSSKSIQNKMFFARQLIYIENEEGLRYYYQWSKRKRCAYEDKVTYRDINEAISEIQSKEMLNTLIDFIDITLDNNFKDNSLNGLYSNLSKAVKNIGVQNSNNFKNVKRKLLELFNRKSEYKDIGKIQYLIEDIENEYIANIKNEENIRSIKAILNN